MEVDVNQIEEFENISRDDPQFVKKCSKLTEGISTGQLTMLQLVEQLGAFLVNKDNDKREFGMWILSQVLSELTIDSLESSQLHFIADFYSNRLKDTHQVIPAVLSGLCAICKFTRFPSDSTQKILRSIFENISCQQQQQQDRYNIYLIFKALLDKHPQEISLMGMDYVYGVISSVDGERDPKNLLFLFNWYGSFLRVVDLKHLNEEMFEILSCYFPVDFKAPPQDPNAISREMLAESLALCLTAVPAFSQSCISLALDKLDSSLRVAKCDSLKLLQLGCVNFDSDSYETSANEIWSKILKELLSNSEKDMDNLCQTTLEVVLRKLECSSILKGLLVNISDTLKRNLIPELKLFHKTADIFKVIAKSSRNATDFVTKEITPLLINTFNLTTTKEHKQILLNVLIDQFVIYTSFYNPIENDDMKSVPVLCLKTAIENNSGYADLKRITCYLTPNQRNTLYDNMKEILLTECGAEVIDCFVQLALDYPQEIQQRFIDKTYLNVLSCIGHLKFFQHDVIDLFLNNIKDENVLDQLRRFIEKNYNDEVVLRLLYEKNIIGTLIDGGITENQLESVRFIIKTIVYHQNSEDQQKIINEQLHKVVRLDNSLRIPLLEAFLIKLRRSVQIDNNLLDGLIDFVKSGDSGLVGAQLLANLLNKCENEQMLDNYLTKIENDWIVFNAESLAWLVKALVMRNHPKSAEWSDKLIDMLGSDVSIAKCFRIIINDKYDCLSPKSYSNLSVLWQQKFFIRVTNKLSATHQAGKIAHLMALCYLLEFTPTVVILLQFKKVLRLVILSMEQLDDPETLKILLNILNRLTLQKESCIEDNLAEFLNRTVKLATFQQSMEVRILSLKLLQNLTRFPVYKLLPLKNQVLLLLGKCVDDKKRLVRREAVQARVQWFLIDAQE